MIGKQYARQIATSRSVQVAGLGLLLWFSGIVVGALVMHSITPEPIATCTVVMLDDQGAEIGQVTIQLGLVDRCPPVSFPDPEEPEPWL